MSIFGCVSRRYEALTFKSGSWFCLDMVVLATACSTRACCAKSLAILYAHINGLIQRNIPSAVLRLASAVQ
jgi:hypothetical protein